jgi:acyl dehydratase
MNLSSDFVGTTLKTYVCPVTARWIMNYAAAVGDPNPLYFNDERPEGIIAPPLFPAAVTWPILENIADYIQGDTFPKEILLTQVHYTEHLAIHRPVKPDCHLTIRGRIAAVLPHRAGTQVVIRFDAIDKSGNLYFTEHIGAMMRGVPCADGGKGGEMLPIVPRQGTETNPIWEAPIPIDPLLPFVYDGCTNIYFPIHTSMKFAHAVGLPGIILQGTCTVALAVHKIIRQEANGDPHRVSQVYCRFTGMVIPGSTIKVRLTGKDRTAAGTDLFFTVLDAADKPAISNGYIKLTD